MDSQPWTSLLLFVALTACAAHHSPGSGPGIGGCDEAKGAPGCGNDGAAGTADPAMGGAGRTPAAVAGGSGSIVGGAGSIAAGAGRGASNPGDPTGADPPPGGSDGSVTCAVPLGRIRRPPASGGELDHALFFSPIYSGYDGVHPFKVPITVRGFLGITWETDRPDLADLERVNDNSAMITTRGAGTARIIARAGSWHGTATLTITRFEPEEWGLGEALYARGGIMDRDQSFVLPDDRSCRRCHSDEPDALSVEYTPQQTGGYSDEELIAISTRGANPPRESWSPGIPMSLYVEAHTWPAASDADTRGLLAYLRSLTPKPACR